MKNFWHVFVASYVIGILFSVFCDRIQPPEYYIVGSICILIQIVWLIYDFLKYDPKDIK